ncbi:hypothetical protein BIU96_07870 [Curtobacterium sp. MCBA15_008]|nr:hypothetical protein BIU96_07870 [Curtobacterium sp. MCBA15_008]
MVTTTEHNESRVFENDVTPLARRLQDFLPGPWDEVRDGHIAPAYVSELSDDDAMREEFLAGAELLGLLDEGMEVYSQQLFVADVINAGAETTVIEMPRRSSKTTSILAVLLGRCLTRARYKVVFSAQSGTKSSEFFRDWLSDMELHQGFTPESEWPYKPRTQAGSMMLTFRNGSTFKVLNTPTAKALRGGAADVVWFDEAQEFTDVQSADLKAGAPPLMDTRDDAQLILSGTPGKVRANWFWDTLVQGRDVENPAVAILEYSAPDSATQEDLADEALWQRVHPGIGTLTTLAKMRARYKGYQDAKNPDIVSPEWSREYMCQWPVAADVAVIPQHLWEAAALEHKLPYPQQVAFGFDISPNGSTAAIVAAWRVDGVAHLELVAHESGSTWLRDRMVALSTKYKAVVGFDPIGSNRVVQEEVSRSRSAAKGRLRPVERGGISPACVTILRDLEDGKVKHFNQQGLNEAAAFAAKRVWGDGSTWSWGRIASGGDITPLVAATMALRAFDEMPAARTLRIITA